VCQRRCSLSHRSQTIRALAHSGFELLHLSAMRIGTCRFPMCGNAPTLGQVPGTSTFMSDPFVPRPLPASPSPFGLALWRLATALLYGCSLLLIPHDLPAAVLALMAALVCLPGARAAILESTGLRVGGAVAASAAAVLLLGAVVRTGLPFEAPTPSGEATGVLLVSTSLASKL
jgi:hypothetical protein